MSGSKIHAGQPEAHGAATGPAAATEPMRRDLYVALVLSLYVELPETPARANAQDRQEAQRLFARGVPGETVETALLLASLRRLTRPAHAPPLARIRSLAYFQPVIEELLQQPARRGYRDYLRRRLSGLAGRLAQGPS